MANVLKRRLLNIIISNGLAVELLIQSKEPKNIINAALNVVQIVQQKFIYYFMQATLK